MISAILTALLVAEPATGLHYDISVTLNQEEQSMDVSVSIDVPVGILKSGEIPIVLDEQMGVPTLQLDGQSVVPTRTRENKGTWGTTFIRYIKADPSTAHQVEATYSTVKSTGFVYKLGKFASYASSSNTHWHPSSGGRVVSADMTFDVPLGQVVKATGKLVSKTDSGERSIFKFHSRAAATLSFAVGPYKVFRDDTGLLPVALYLFKEREWTDEAVAQMRQVADALSEWFGPYPFDEMAIVEVQPDANFVAGFSGASLEGFLLAVPKFIDGKDKGPNLAFIGHELGHAWWGHQIKSVSGSAPFMLSEAMAQFGSLKAVEAIDGEAAARQYRTTGYPGYISSQSGRGALRTMKRGFDPPLGQLPSGTKSHTFSDSKGFQIYHQLEQVVGDDALKSALKEFQRENAWKRVTIEQFFDEVEKHSKMDLDWFYKQWFKSGGAPRWKLDWSQDSADLFVTVSQSGEPYRFTTEIEVIYEDGTKQRWKVHIDEESEKLRFILDKKAKEVILDPDWDVFHWDEELVDLSDGDGLKRPERD